MLRNNKGVALAQVLLMTVVLAGMAAMLLRVSMSRANISSQINRRIRYQSLINACQAEVNALWAVKTPESFARDLSTCTMRRHGNVESADRKFYYCNPVAFEGVNYRVKAYFPDNAPDADGKCRLRYAVAKTTRIFDDADCTASADYWCGSNWSNGGGNGGGYTIGFEEEYHGGNESLELVP